MQGKNVLLDRYYGIANTYNIFGYTVLVLVLVRNVATNLQLRKGRANLFKNSSIFEN